MKLAVLSQPYQEYWHTESFSSNIQASYAAFSLVATWFNVSVKFPIHGTAPDRVNGLALFFVPINWFYAKQGFLFEARLIEESAERCEHPPWVFVSCLSRYSKFSGKKVDAPFAEAFLGKSSRSAASQRRTSVIFRRVQGVLDYDTGDYASPWWAYGGRVSLARPLM